MTRHEPYEIAGYIVPAGKPVVLFANLVDGAGAVAPAASPESVVRAQASAHGGEELAAKRAGLFVFVFDSVHVAARCALACHRAVDAYNRETGCAARLYMAAHTRPVRDLEHRADANGGYDENTRVSSDDGAGTDERAAGDCRRSRLDR
jgi:hypothetical protein